MIYKRIAEDLPLLDLFVQDLAHQLICYNIRRIANFFLEGTTVHESFVQGVKKVACAYENNIRPSLESV
jgi:hypothetical protein